MKLLSREQLLRKRARRTDFVPLPEIEPDSGVTIRAMREGERSEYEASFLDKDGKPKMISIKAARRKLIILSVIDESGNPLLTAGDVDALAETDSAAMSRLYNKARDLSGFEDKDIEELVGNSSAPNGAVQPSVSPTPQGDGTSTD